jgi:hypothetical protein
VKTLIGEVLAHGTELVVRETPTGCGTSLSRSAAGREYRLTHVAAGVRLRDVATNTFSRRHWKVGLERL